MKEREDNHRQEEDSHQQEEDNHQQVVDSHQQEVEDHHQQEVVDKPVEAHRVLLEIQVAVLFTTGFCVNRRSSSCRPGQRNVNST